MTDNRTPKGQIVVFGEKQVRRTWHEDQWYFSVVDIIGVLTDSPNPRNYWNMMKARERKGSGTELSTFCVQLKLPSADGKSYTTDCVSTQNAFRIIQSIPSPKAEPFKRWLAKVGYERVQELKNPDLAYLKVAQHFSAGRNPAPDHTVPWGRLSAFDVRSAVPRGLPFFHPW